MRSKTFWRIGELVFRGVNITFSEKINLLNKRRNKCSSKSCANCQSDDQKPKPDKGLTNHNIDSGLITLIGRQFVDPGPVQHIGMKSHSKLTIFNGYFGIASNAICSENIAAFTPSVIFIPPSFYRSGNIRPV